MSHRAVALALSAVSVAATASPSKPHILLMINDDYGYNDIGYHQNTVTPVNPTGAPTTNNVVPTPNMDQLAAEGVKLHSYYVQPLCSPTRATIVSGRYPSHTGLGPYVILGANPYGLPVDETSIAQVLKEQAGYRTAAIGKWHIGFCMKEMTPTFRGFDSFMGYLNGMEDYYTHVASQNGLHAYDFRNSTFDSLNQLPPDASRDPAYEGVYSTTLYAARARDLVTHHSANYPDTPLFLYHAWQSVHTPLEVPQSYEEPFSAIPDPHRRTYAGMVAALDEAIGEVVESYKGAGMWDDTVLILTTDNGGEAEHGSTPHVGGNNFPLRGQKTTVWEGGMRGVGFVRGTNNLNLSPLPAGSSTNALMHSTDWLPTVAGLAGISEPTTNKPLDGFNVWPVLTGAQNATARTIIAHNVPTAAEGKGGAFRYKDYKLLYAYDPNSKNDALFDMEVTADEPQWALTGFDNMTLVCDIPKAVDGKYLFNIAKDPLECHNLVGEASAADALAEIEKAFETYQTDKASPVVPDLNLKYRYKVKNAVQDGGVWGPFPNGCYRQ